MKTTVALVAFLSLVACAGTDSPTVAQLETECGVGRLPFEDSWPCMRAAILRVEASRDVVAGYIAVGNVIDERVRAGQMTQAEARLAMVKAEQDARAIETARVYGRQAVMMNAARQMQIYTPPPPRQVNCTTYRYGTIAQTNCY